MRKSVNVLIESIRNEYKDLGEGNSWGLSCMESGKRLLAETIIEMDFETNEEIMLLREMVRNLQKDLERIRFENNAIVRALWEKANPSRFVKDCRIGQYVVTHVELCDFNYRYTLMNSNGDYKNLSEEELLLISTL